MTDAEISDRLITYTARLRETGAIRSDEVARAFATVPRHLFIDAVYHRSQRRKVGEQPTAAVLDEIYGDKSLMTHHTGSPSSPRPASSWHPSPTAASTPSSPFASSTVRSPPALSPTPTS